LSDCEPEVNIKIPAGSQPKMPKNLLEKEKTGEKSTCADEIMSSHPNIWDRIN